MDKFFSLRMVSVIMCRASLKTRDGHCTCKQQQQRTNMKINFENFKNHINHIVKWSHEKNDKNNRVITLTYIKFSLVIFFILLPEMEYK